MNRLLALSLFLSAFGSSPGAGLAGAGGTMVRSTLTLCRPPRHSIPLVLVFALISMRAWAADVSLTFGSLPSSQGWTYAATGADAGTPETAVFSLSGGALQHNSIGQGFGAGSIQYVRSEVLNDSEIIVLEISARLISIEGDSQNGCYGYGFNFGLSTATHGYQFGFMPDRIRDNCPVPRDIVFLDNTVSHDYRFEFLPVGKARVYVDGVLRAVTDALPPAPAPGLFLGDGTGTTNAAAEITRYRVSQPGEPPFACAPAPPGMLHWWPGDGSGEDLRGGAPGILENGAGFAPGMVGQAFRLDGADDLLRFPTASALSFAGDFSIGYWFKSTSGAGQNQFRAYNPASQVGIVVFGNAQSADLYAPYPSNWVRINHLNLSDDRWHHLVLQRSGTNVTYYIDGILRDTRTLAGDLSSHVDITFGPPNGYTGLIDELQIYGRALDPADIVAQYQALTSGMCKEEPTPPACAPAPSGLVAWWPGEGNGLDVVGIHHGAVVGGTSFAAARVGAGFTFDSNDDRVIVPHSTDLDVQASGFTAALWMQGTKSQPEVLATLLEKSHGWTDNTGWAFQVESSSGVMHFGLGDGAGFTDLSAGIDVLDGNPHHLVGTWEAGTLRFYVDGILRATAAHPTPVNNNRDVNLGFTWGGGTPRRFFRGYLDEVQLFDRALSEAEISAIVDAGAAGVCPPPPPPCVPAPANLIAWWPGEGDANDVVAGHHGTTIAGATFAAGRVNQAFQFDGVDDYVSVPDDPAWDLGTNDFTIHLWVNFDQIKNSMFIHQQSGSGFGGFEFDYQPGSGQLVFSKDGFGGGLGRAWSPQSGLWYHLAVTRTAGTYRLFVNGAQLGAPQFDPSPIPDVTGVVRIGSWAGDNTFFVDGRIDELTLVGRALAPTEIAAIAGAGTAGVCAPAPVACVPAPSGLVSWWPADGNANDVRAGNHGTITGATFGPGRAGLAFEFDGVDDHIVVPDAASLDVTTALTIEAWVHPLQAKIHRVITKWGMAGFRSYNVDIGGSGEVSFYTSSDGTNHHFKVTGGGAAPVGQWTHIACVFEGGVSQLIYVNGVLRSTSTGGPEGLPSSLFNSTSPFQLAKNFNDSPGPYSFHGRLDDVRLYDRALTGAEIASLHAVHSGLCQDSGPPVVTAPPGASHACASQVPAAAPEQATATDDVAVVSLTVSETSNGGAGSPASPLVITRTWTATDADGNSASDSQTITVVDDTPPTLTVPAGITLTAGPGIEPCADVRVLLESPGAGTAEDNCGTAEIALTGVPEGGLYPVGVTTLAWTATDAAGNTASGSQTVTVLCPVGTIAGGATLTCNGVTQPAAGTTVRLLHEGSPFRETLTGDDGGFGFGEVRLGTYTVAIVAPAGYAAPVDTRLLTLTGEGATVQAEPFGFVCLLGDIAGRVEGTCDGTTTGLQGVTVDVYRDDGSGTDVLVATLATDADGNFRVDDLALGDYAVGIVLPLGYTTTSSSSQTVTLDTPDGLVTAATFALTCQAIAAQPRSMGYWKHQVNVYLTGKGKAQESLTDLLHYVDELVEHFNENLVNPVVVYVPGVTSTNDKLLQLQQLLTVNRGATMLDRAKQQLLALLLNVVSGKIAQTEVISDDGATVSQAITYSHDLIVDSNPSNDETAKTICDLINNGQRVPAGMVPTSTRIITYNRLPAQGQGPETLSLGPITPNPVTLEAVITFALPHEGSARLEIHDPAGRLVARQEVGGRGAGLHTLRIADLGTLRPGVYLVRLTQGTATQTRRMAVIR